MRPDGMLEPGNRFGRLGPGPEESLPAIATAKRRAPGQPQQQQFMEAPPTRALGVA